MKTSKMELIVRCNFGGGGKSPPPPPAPPIPPSEQQASTVAKESLKGKYDPRTGRRGTILTDPAMQPAERTVKKSLLGQ